MSRRRIVLAVAAVVAAWIVGVGVLLLQAVRELEAGRVAALSARADLDLDAIVERRPLVPLAKAADHFAKAERSTSNPLLAPMKFLPVVGRQLRSASSLSAAASDAASTATVGLEAVGVALEMDNSDGPSRLAQVTALRDAAETTHRRLVAINDFGPSRALLSQLAHARNDLVEELVEATESLADASAGADAARDLLQGPRRYLVMAANNAEMRAGSGMWLSAGVLTTGQGELELSDMVSISDSDMRPRPATVTIGDLSNDLLARWAFATPAEEWRNLMLSPDFPASAQLAANMWEALWGEQVDGVLAVDPVALQAVMRATGPVEIDGRVITADQVVPELLHDQYERAGDTTAGLIARRDLLGRLAERAVNGLRDSDWDPAVLARELAGAIKGRHLMAWSRDEQEARGWQAARMGGSLAENHIAVSLLNTSGAKTDWFVRNSVAMEVAGVGQDTEVTLTVKVSNQVPVGEVAYVAGPSPALERVLQAGDHRALLAVNAPREARMLRVDGVDDPTVIGQDGTTRMIAHEVLIPRGQERTYIVRFRLPGHTGRVEVTPSARVPFVPWQFRQDSWQDTEQHTVKW